MPYGSPAFKDSLRLIARTLMSEGRLPMALSAVVDAGYGSGAVCRLCEQPIDQYHIEYEVTDARDGSTLSFHLTCHRAWRLECADQALRRPQGIGRIKMRPH